MDKKYIYKKIYIYIVKRLQTEGRHCISAWIYFFIVYLVCQQFSANSLTVHDERERETDTDRQAGRQRKTERQRAVSRRELFICR